MAENLIFNEPALAFADLGNGLFAWQSDTNIIPLTVGETYIVEWDGTRHSCQAVSTVFNDTDVVVMGNFGLLGSGENNGMPFLMGSALAGDLSLCYTTDNDATNAVAIYQVVEDGPDKEYLIWGSTLKGIANAIRAKNGTSGEIAVSDMAAKISEITGGGGSSDDVRYVTFMSEDGTVEYGKKAVAVGDDCADPIARGVFDTPTKESTPQYNYTFAGWSTEVNGGLDENALKSVTADRTVYANFIATVIHYNISYYDGDTLLTTELLAYGAIPSYVPKKDGYTFTGWSPEAVAVTEDATYYAQWIERVTFANGSWAQIAEISESGQAQEYFSVGDTKEITWGGNTYKLVILGFDHDDLADGSGKAGMTVGVLTAHPTGVQAQSNATANGVYWDWEYYCKISKTIRGFESQSDLADIVAVAKEVKKYSWDEYYSKNRESTDTFFAFSMTETGVGTKTTGNRYAYFTDYNKLKVMEAGAETYVQYWLRDQNQAPSTTKRYWYAITSGGSVSTTIPVSNNCKLVFGFCV